MEVKRVFIQIARPIGTNPGAVDEHKASATLPKRDDTDD
jgi:hypothetical protein